MQIRWTLYRIMGLAALCAVFWQVGCGSHTGHADSTEVPTPANAASTTNVSLQILDYNGIQKLIADHRGQVVVLDCWATSCPPCIEEFPKLVALHKKYDPAQLACISLSFDFEGLGKPEDVQADVLKFLQTHGAAFDNILCSESSDALLKKLNLASIPAVFVYDRQGNVHRFEGSKAYEEVPALIEKLITTP